MTCSVRRTGITIDSLDEAVDLLVAIKSHGELRLTRVLLQVHGSVVQKVKMDLL